MNSIRSRLLLWLMPGFILLWVVGGYMLYHFYRSAEMNKFDDELMKTSIGIFKHYLPRNGRLANLPPQESHFRRELFETLDSGYYFQILDSNGNSILNSTSLGDRVLPFTQPFSNQPITINIEGSDFRYMVMKRPGFGSPIGPQFQNHPPPVHYLIVAFSLSSFQSSLKNLLLILILMGITGIILGAVLIGLALQHGLSPLNRLGKKVSAIGPQNLSTRLDKEDVPKEILPFSEQLNSLLQRLEGAFQRERQFSSDLAHELRTPLAEIRSLIELGILYPDEVSREQQQQILDSSARMERMVEAMLKLARLENTKSDTQQTICLQEIIRKNWRSYQVKAEKRKLRLVNQLEENYNVNGCPEIWSHLINNVLSNAVEYAPEGSDITIQSNNPKTILSITNPAPQLKENEIEKLFDRFWRADHARTGEKHSGIGLSIAKACAEAMNLSLTAELQENALLCFSIREK